MWSLTELEGAGLKAVFLLMWQETGGLTAAAESVNLTDCSQLAPSFKGTHSFTLSIKNVLNVTNSPLSAMW